MTIQLLGTGAADGVPPLFTPNRLGSRSFGPDSKDYRTRASALIDDCIKIDLGPDTLAQNQRFQIDPNLWEAIVFTHSHEDHFTVSEIQYALYPFNMNEYTPFTVYSNSTVKRLIELRYPDWPLDLVETKLYETITICGYQMTPVRAKHAEPEECQNLVFEKDGKVFGYMTDTGIWPEITWDYISGVKFDAMVIECTDGLCDSGYDGHLALWELEGVLERLHKQGSISKGVPIFTTHHSHLGGSHEELVEAMKPLGAAPGYDGLKIIL
ncbi:MAG TPA: MBL fold metallo-hydrolase [Fimbriimonadaceae bacterium]|nr:MBL fold metallo-hydrolase [Fimbriimonadaceae bacterium]